MTQHTINRSDLMHRLAVRCRLHPTEAEKLVKTILEAMMAALTKHDRIELRGFGSFEVRYRQPRLARNPRTGEKIQTNGTHTVHFKPGKLLRQRVDLSKTDH